MTIFLPQPSTHGSQPPYQSASTSQQCSNLLLMIRKLSVMDSCQLDETQIPSLGRTVLVLRKVAGQSCQAILHLVVSGSSSSPRDRQLFHSERCLSPQKPSPSSGPRYRDRVQMQYQHMAGIGIFFLIFFFQMKWDTDDAFSPFPKPNWSMTVDLCELGSSTPQHVSERLQKLLHRPV